MTLSFASHSFLLKLRTVNGSWLYYVSKCMAAFPPYDISVSSCVMWPLYAWETAGPVHTILDFYGCDIWPNLLQHFTYSHSGWLFYIRAVYALQTRSDNYQVGVLLLGAELHNHKYIIPTCDYIMKVRIARGTGTVSSKQHFLERDKRGRWGFFRWNTAFFTMILVFKKYREIYK